MTSDRGGARDRAEPRSAPPSPLSPHPSSLVFSDLDALSHAAAEAVVEAAARAVEARGRFTMALSGGSTPRRTYELLAGPYAARMPWGETELFLGDERWVPPDDPLSNFAMAMATLAGAPLVPSRVHMVPFDPKGSPDEGARAYEAVLRERLGATSLTERRETDEATLDLALMGLGKDGHTASLFPGSPALEERQRWVVGVDAPTHIEPHVPRVTMTYPAFDRAREALFLVAGADKRDVLSVILAGGPDAERYPAARVRARERVRWFVERTAY